MKVDLDNIQNMLIIMMNDNLDNDYNDDYDVYSCNSVNF